MSSPEPRHNYLARRVPDQSCVPLVDKIARGLGYPERHDARVAALRQGWTRVSS